MLHSSSDGLKIMASALLSLGNRFPAIPRNSSRFSPSDCEDRPLPLTDELGDD
jgi:hypothetical protein